MEPQLEGYEVLGTIATGDRTVLLRARRDSDACRSSSSCCGRTTPGPKRSIGCAVRSRSSPASTCRVPSGPTAWNASGEMLTGAVPFRSDDALEMVHCHLAVRPVEPVDRNPKVPAVLPDIVLRFLAKQPEDRYQSAYGLRRDLAVCLERSTSQGELVSFPLGLRRRGLVRQQVKLLSGQPGSPFRREARPGRCPFRAPWRWRSPSG